VGMLMTHLINTYRYRLCTLLYDSEAQEGEMIIEYAEKEYKGEPHVGETPAQVAAEIVAHGRRAVGLVESMGKATRNTDELRRVLNDVYIHSAFAAHYSAKAKAATQVLSYRYRRNDDPLNTAVPNPEESA